MKKILIYFIALLAIAILPLKSAFSGGHYSGPDLSGQKVVIFGPWMAPEDESFRDVVSIFEKAMLYFDDFLILEPILLLLLNLKTLKKRVSQQ